MLDTLSFNGSNWICRRVDNCMVHIFILIFIDLVKTFIIFSNRHEIRRLDISAETYVPLVSGLRNTIALDFYYNHTNNGENSAIFWTDVVDDKIYKGVLISNCK